MRYIFASLFAVALYGQTAVPIIPGGLITARGAHTLTLDGSGSTCSGGCLYAWRQTGGAPITIGGSTTATPTVYGVFAGQYTVELIVKAISGGAVSAPVALTFGGVATDSQNVTTPSANALTSQLVGSHVRQGLGPWPTADYRQQFMADYYASLYGVGNLWPAFWEDSAPLTGTITIDSPTDVDIVGTGTLFLSELACGTSDPNAQRYIIVIYQDPTQGNRTRYHAKDCVSSPDNTHLTWSYTETMPVGTFQFVSCTINQRHVWTNTQTYINYYENVVSHRMMYARTGLERHHEAFRWLASKWLTNPFFNMGESDGDGFDAAPRNANLLGLMLYADDGHPEVWPWMNYKLNQLILYITRTDGDTLPPQDAREFGFALWQVAVCAKYHTDVAMGGQRELCLDAVNASLNTHVAPYIQADGTMYNWYTDPANLIGPTASAVNLGDTIITSGAATSGVVNTTGADVTGTSGSAFDSTYVNRSIIINGVAYTVTVVTDGTHLTLCSSAGSQTGAAWSTGKFPNISTGCGTVNTSGTAVTGTGGTSFTAGYVGKQINIASVPFTVLSVADSTHLTLTTSAGSQTGAAWALPRLAAADDQGPYTECSGDNSSFSGIWFTVAGNRRGDLVGYRCTWLDSLRIRLATPYADTGSGSGAVKYWQLRWDTEIGVGAQPFMQGIGAQGLTAAYEATSDPRIPNWVGGTTSLATFLQTTGYKADSFGMWYGRAFGLCEPDPTLRVLCKGTEYPAGTEAGDAGTRFLLGEVLMGVQYGRNFFPANTPQDFMTLGNGVLWAEGGGPMTSGGFTDPNTAPAQVVASKKAKDNGFMWGIGGMSRLAAYYLGGYAGPALVTRGISFGSPGATTSIEVRTGAMTSSTITACPTSPCSVSLDTTTGGVYRVLRGGAVGGWINF